MPQYWYRCPSGHPSFAFLSVKNHRRFVDCQVCGVLAEQIITAPMLVKVAADVCYDSPIDGTPITSWDKRNEDLKRNNCSPYDPLIKQDYHARIARNEKEMDKKIEAHVEASIEKMPGHKRAKLHSELVEQGKDIDVVRLTPNG